MDILVIHTTLSVRDRKNMSDHLYSFKRYAKGHRFYYLDVKNPKAVTRLIQSAAFDGVIFHYSFLSQRYNPAIWQPLYAGVRQRLMELKGFKVALPQDEYHYTASLWQLFRDVGVGHIFSIAREANFDIIFPADKTGGAAVSPVLTGYIDPASLGTIARLQKKVPVRDIDIGYRARKLPYYCGRHGLLKYEIVEQFAQAVKGRDDIVADLGNTGNTSNTFLEDDWWEFLLRCRTMPGCLGGSDVFDPDGSIRACGDAYLAAHPQAEIGEIEAACFPGRDGEIHSHMLSPRHFECAMTKTCQVLVEDDYHGIFKPGVHYIELKRDFSNIDAVLAQMMDVGYCEQVARRCYEDIVGDAGADNPNTYIWFANHVADCIAQNVPEGKRRMGAFERLRVRVCCWRVHRGVRLGLRLYNIKAAVYTGVCRFLAKRPGLKAWVERVFRREFG